MFDCCALAMVCMFAGCCLLVIVVCSSLIVVCGLLLALCVARCVLFVVRCLVFVVCRFVVCCVCCLLSVGWCQAVCVAFFFLRRCLLLFAL